MRVCGASGAGARNAPNGVCDRFLSRTLAAPGYRSILACVARNLEAAFPASVRESVSAAVSVMPAAELEPVGSFTVRVDDADVVIPGRIYNAEPPADLIDALGEPGRDVLSCLYTRHHDGYVRQRHLRRIVRLPDSWVVPFVVQLVGEYVVEILVDIQEALTELDVEGSPQRLQYGRFVADNPAFIELTAQRVASYWDCYYRSAHPEQDDYPGFQLVWSLRDAGAAQAVSGPP
jgi:hypothetical protein